MRLFISILSITLIAFSCDEGQDLPEPTGPEALTELEMDCIATYEPPTDNYSRNLLCERAHRLVCQGFTKDHLEVRELCRMFNWENWSYQSYCPACN